MMPSNASSPLLVKRMQTPSADRSLGTTKTPLDAPPMRYKRIHVPGEDEVDLDRVVDPAPGGDWRRIVGS